MVRERDPSRGTLQPETANVPTASTAHRENNFTLALENARLRRELRDANAAVARADREIVEKSATSLAASACFSSHELASRTRDTLKLVRSSIQTGLGKLADGLQDLTDAVAQLDGLVASCGRSVSPTAAGTTWIRNSTSNENRPIVTRRPSRLDENASSLSPILDSPASEPSTNASASGAINSKTQPSVTLLNPIVARTPPKAMVRRSKPFNDFGQHRVEGAVSSRFVACTAESSAQRQLHTIYDDTGPVVVDEHRGADVHEGQGGDRVADDAGENVDPVLNVNTRRRRNVTFENALALSDIRTPSPAVGVGDTEMAPSAPIAVDSDNDMFDEKETAALPPPSQPNVDNQIPEETSPADDETFVIDREDSTSPKPAEQPVPMTDALHGQNHEISDKEPSHLSGIEPEIDQLNVKAQSHGKKSSARKRRSDEKKDPSCVKKHSPHTPAQLQPTENTPHSADQPNPDSSEIGTLPPRPPTRSGGKNAAAASAGSSASTCASTRRRTTTATPRSMQTRSSPGDNGLQGADTPTGVKARSVPRRCADIKSEGESPAVSENGSSRPRRAATKPVSYKEPSMNKKLRQGDDLFLLK